MLVENVLKPDDIQAYGGGLRDFIYQDVRGGRCMTRDNKSYHTVEELDDFDAVSLYPSAMSRLHLPLG
jgi:hypothetical protein